MFNLSFAGAMLRRNRVPALMALLAIAGLVMAPSWRPPLRAQVVRTPEARLADRLDERTLRLVLAQVDSAERAGLPVDGMVSRALEGRRKGAPPAAIVDGVRRVRLALGSARAALGAATAVEVKTGASAIEAGAQPQVLAQLRRARPEGSLLVPLSVLTDLVGLGVPVDTATRTVLALARVPDAALLAFQRDVERDVSVGALPALAASVRAAGLERTVGADLASPSPLNGPGTLGPIKRPPRKP